MGFTSGSFVLLFSVFFALIRWDNPCGPESISHVLRALRYKFCMTDNAFDAFMPIGRAASTLLPANREWKWEDRLMTVVVLEIEETGAVYRALKDLCTDTWTASNVVLCSPEVGALVTEMAGLRDGQFLFATTLDVNSFAYFTTWPWEDGTHVSVRFGVYYPAGQLSDYAMSNLVIKRGLEIG